MVCNPEGPLDQIDRRILVMLQNDAKTRNSELARRLGKAPSAILERVRKLEEKGYIDGYGAHLNRNRLDLGLLAFITVRTRDTLTCEQTVKALVALPHVLECHDIAGQDCYLIKVCAKDTADLNKLIKTELGRLPSVVSTRTTVVLETYKESFQLPIEASP